MGVQCEVVAPTLVPVKVGDRVKTDRRDAEKLARCYRSGDLTAVWVPDEGSEALRDLVRACEAAKQDQTRARHRLSKFLLRSGQRPPSGVRPWTRPYLIWVAQLRFTQSAQEFTRQDYLHEVEHMRGRVERLEQAIMEAVKLASHANFAVGALAQNSRPTNSGGAPGVCSIYSNFHRSSGAGSAETAPHDQGITSSIQCCHYKMLL